MISLFYTNIFSIVFPLQWIRLNESGNAPQCNNNRAKCSITIPVLVSDFKSTLFPVNKAATNYKIGISYGKLKGVIKATLP